MKRKALMQRSRSGSNTGGSMSHTRAQSGNYYRATTAGHQTQTNFNNLSSTDPHENFTGHQSQNQFSQDLKESVVSPHNFGLNESAIPMTSVTPIGYMTNPNLHGGYLTDDQSHQDIFPIREEHNFVELNKTTQQLMNSRKKRGGTHL